MIEAVHLSRTFGRFTAVDSVDFAISAGQLVGFLGPNGAGKTTTIRMICGFLRPTGGTVRVGGHDVVDQSLDARRCIGYLPESAPTYGELRVVEYLRYRAALFDVPRARRRASIARALERCDLTDVRRRAIHHLSKGYRQRVGLAAAMLHEPPVLVLDEPTVGLDPSQIQAFRSLIRGLAGDHTVLLSSHILPDVEQICDRLLMMVGGRVRADGTIDDLRAAAGRLGRYTLETRAADLEPALRDLAGVRTITDSPVGDGWTRLTIDARHDAPDLREAIWSVLAARGAPIRELHRETPSLEQVFMRVVSGEAVARAVPEVVS